MAFTTIDPNIIKVGDPITKEIFDLIKNNFDDVDARVNGLSVSGSNIYMLNEEVSFVSFDDTYEDFWYWKVPKNMTISGMKVQLFSKQGLSSGTFTVDLQKATSTDPAGFATVLSVLPSFNFASALNYSEVSATIDAGQATLSLGNVLRLKVTSFPSGWRDRVLILIWGS